MDKIICVGKNYLEHARELGDKVPDKPVLFLKPPSVLRQVPHWEETLLLTYPENEPQVQPECEIVLCMGCDGYQLPAEQAKLAISGVTLGLDMTLRTLQSQLKQQGHPWTTAKVFKDAAVIGPWIPLASFSNYLDVPFEMSVNQELRQKGRGHEMMMLPEDLLVYISHFFPLKQGDVIFTGTPVGVSNVDKNDLVNLQWAKWQYAVRWE